MSRVTFTCGWCGGPGECESGSYNRAMRVSGSVCCSRACAHARRRRPQEEKKARKAAYDRERRAAIGDKIRQQKRDHYHATKEERADILREYRRRRRHYHAAYCRRPEYVAWKKEYDRAYRAREYGEMADAYLALLALEKEVDERASPQELAAAKGTVNKCQTRRREYEAQR